MTRRSFLATAFGAAAVSSQAPRIRLGYDSYSLRAFRWKAIQLLDYAAALKLDSVQLSGLTDYESLDPAYLRKVKDHATALGLTIDGGIGCICPTSKSWKRREGKRQRYLEKGLAVCKAVGAKSMRCFLGAAADGRGPVPIEANIENTVRELKKVRSMALDHQVVIAVENHS